MQDDTAQTTTDLSSLRARLEAEAPPAPPPMPGARPAGMPATPAEPAESGGWSVDPYSMRGFVQAIGQVRDCLREVNDRVEQMRSAGYTPKLGTSPVATQLERKFADRLDAALDNPQQPTSGGLRPMLAEATRRMEEFVTGAEAALRDYQELDQQAASQMHRSGHHHHG